MELVPCKKNRLKNWIGTYIFKETRAWKMIAAREKNPKRQKKFLWRYIHISVVSTLKTDCLIIERDNMT